MPTVVPVYFGSPNAAQLADDLRKYGVAAVDTMRTAARHLAAEVEWELGLPSSLEDHGEFLLHLSCVVQPAMEIGSIDYYVYPPAFDRDAMAARRMVEAAVRQWHSAGQPSRYEARLNV
ncbi:hypothetical protein [Xanthomonas vasicola]|uniref:hypothetical protein n=1 Tax=Xanthomonas vasicola TaxID=56459 RepID=UPI000F851A95|nr:hypothetical protein [Xanthomonas vasicola]AZR23475.1 hypothetical protein NX81_015565 [Xanthomonas vasicola]TWQ32322.1 hypothetical protein FQJ96_22800 [Xanthomonas vasicola]TWQ50736.1 hypothetical protein FQJ93_22805 [Xanthomonas vasicola]TWQ69574.1 hypothetical protein FQJ89_23160 [Xanthomonas vasicola]